MIVRTLAAFLRNRRGAAAAEFALVLSAMLFFTLGAFNITLVLSAVSGLNRAAEAAARYASVQTSLTGADPGSSAVTTWASGQYKGPNIGATFTYSPDTGCGHTVNATGTYQLITGFAQVPLALGANACFP
ncbi:MAG TPA: TadE/TadG family type IV pilus assembly protein [Caulobacteraceae bacterium]|jgi:Flp pilus assembly protein TadG